MSTHNPKSFLAKVPFKDGGRASRTTNRLDWDVSDRPANKKAVCSVVSKDYKQ